MTFEYPCVRIESFGEGYSEHRQKFARLVMTNSDNRQPLSGRVDDSRPARPDWSGIGAGITFLALAALALYAGWDLPPTRASAMGPGTFPYVLTVLLGVLGAVVLIEGVLCRGSNVGGVAIVRTIVVFAAAIAFTLVIKPFGFIAAGSLTGAVVGLYGLRTQRSEEHTSELQSHSDL